MKIAGWFFLILGILSLVGTTLAGHNATGPAFCLALGLFLLYQNMKKGHDDEM